MDVKRSKMTNRSTEPNYCGLSFLKEYDDWYLLRASLMLQNEHQEIPVIEYFLIWKLKHVSGMKRTKTLTLNDADTFPKNNCVFNVFNLALFTSKENDKTRILNEFNLTVNDKTRILNEFNLTVKYDWKFPDWEKLFRLWPFCLDYSTWTISKACL